MDAATFTAGLRAEGFGEILERAAPPGAALDEHAHAWDSRGLVLAGEFRVTSARGEQRCAVGQWFDLARDELHTEAAGPDGARLLIGRRHPA